ncbi:MAG: cyclic nucleotide-binding domain-containing protein [Deltaproteobacteria bacterium]
MSEQKLDENIELVKRLKELPLFSSLDDNAVKGILKLCKLVQYEPDEVVFEEGQFDDRIFFLISGKVKIVKRGVELNTLRRRGDVFGEMGIIGGKARSASIIATDKTTCLIMDASYMDRLHQKDRDTCLYVIYRVFSDILSERLRDTTSELIKAKEDIARLKDGGK